MDFLCIQWDGFTLNGQSDSRRSVGGSMIRRTIVASVRALLNAAVVELARSGGGSGACVTPIEGLAARLAGGFLSPIESEPLSRAVGAILAEATDAELG